MGSVRYAGCWLSSWISRANKGKVRDLALGLAPVIVRKSYSRLIREARGDPYGVVQVRGLLAKLLAITSLQRQSTRSGLGLASVARQGELGSVITSACNHPLQFSGWNDSKSSDF